MFVTDFIILQRNILHAMPACIDYKVGSGNISYVRGGVNMDDTQIEMLPVLGEFSSIASQYEHIMFYYESGIQQIVAKLQILNNELDRKSVV